MCRVYISLILLMTDSVAHVHSYTDTRSSISVQTIETNKVQNVFCIAIPLSICMDFLKLGVSLTCFAIELSLFSHFIHWLNLNEWPNVCRATRSLALTVSLVAHERLISEPANFHTTHVYFQIPINKTRCPTKIIAQSVYTRSAETNA